MCKRTEYMLRERSEFEHVKKTGKLLRTDSFMVQLTPNDLGRARLGIAVTTKVANAVGRNRVKRLVRECFRAGIFPTDNDIVVIAKRSIDVDTLTYQSVYTELSTLFTTHYPK